MIASRSCANTWSGTDTRGTGDGIGGQCIGVPNTALGSAAPAPRPSRAGTAQAPAARRAHNACMRRGRAIEVLSSTASAEEAAAIVAAVEHFVRDTAPRAPAGEGDGRDPWLRAGILEGVEGGAPEELGGPWP